MLTKNKFAVLPYDPLSERLDQHEPTKGQSAVLGYAQMDIVVTRHAVSPGSMHLHLQTKDAHYKTNEFMYDQKYHGTVKLYQALGIIVDSYLPIKHVLTGRRMRIRSGVHCCDNLISLAILEKRIAYDSYGIAYKISYHLTQAAENLTLSYLHAS